VIQELEQTKVTSSNPSRELLEQLQRYLREPGAPNMRLSPKWLASKLQTDERDLLGALAYGVRDGLVEIHWEVYCPLCGGGKAEIGSLKHARGNIECLGCQTSFDLHLDRDVRVTFSASERLRRARGEAILAAGDEETLATPGLDLLLVPAFWELFSGEAPATDESLRIGRVAILFTDLRDSTAMYAAYGDPRAYRLVRDHFALLSNVIARNNGTIVKTIGDAVMASFGSGVEAVRAAFESQAELRARAAEMGGELILKAGVHAGACLAVKLNDRLDFFGGAVNTAARVQALSHGNDVLVTNEVIREIESEEKRGSPYFRIEEKFDARLRGLPHPVRVNRLVATTRNTLAGPNTNRSLAAKFSWLIKRK
jgi:class 3 adenylate cyclase